MMAALLREPARPEAVCGHRLAPWFAGDAATGGGMVNMTRGIGTALGVAIVTLGLHAGKLAGDCAAGPQVAMAALAMAALAAAWAGMRAGR